MLTCLMIYIDVKIYCRNNLVANFPPNFGLIYVKHLTEIGKERKFLNSTNNMGFFFLQNECMVKQYYP